MSGVILETERLSLREITADDLDDLLEIWGDPEAMRYFPRTLDHQAMREWIERNGLRIEKEVLWRGYQHYVYAIEWNVR
jgi:RimJ/RimL family protein N-acetyltransferase